MPFMPHGLDPFSHPLCLGQYPDQAPEHVASPNQRLGGKTRRQLLSLVRRWSLQLSMQVWALMSGGLQEVRRAPPIDAARNRSFALRLRSTIRFFCESVRVLPDRCHKALRFVPIPGLGRLACWVRSDGCSIFLTHGYPTHRLNRTEWAYSPWNNSRTRPAFETCRAVTRFIRGDQRAMAQAHRSYSCRFVAHDSHMEPCKSFVHHVVRRHCWTESGQCLW